MRIACCCSAVALIALLSACGKPLGEYHVRSVSVVPAEAEPARNPRSRAGEPMLRVEFTSRTDLYEASDGGGSGLYVLASFCPYRDERTLYIGEPYYNDRDRYGPTRVVEMSEIEERRPAKDASGMYVYTTYLALSRPGAPEQSGIPEQFAYDLRRQPLDLCLRIYHPGYFITPSQSQVFTIRAAMIQRAIKPARAARRGSSSASGQDDPPSVI